MIHRTLVLLVLAAMLAACAPPALSSSPAHPARVGAPTPAATARSSTLGPGVAGDVLADPSAPPSAATMAPDPAAPAPASKVPPPAEHHHGGSP